MKGPTSREIARMLRNNPILNDLGISPTTFVQAFKTVELLTTRQLHEMVHSNIKRANTTFRVHSLDRGLTGFLTADLPVEPNTPGKIRLIFKHRDSSVRCMGLIDDHHGAAPLPTGHEIILGHRSWPGVSMQELLCC
eukprot:3412631-Rhodomonas_salina.2